MRSALKYNKKTPDIVNAFCSRENYTYKWQLNKFLAAENCMDWTKDLRKDYCYINEEELYETVFSSQQSKSKDFRRHCCSVLFPHVRQQLTNKIQKEHQQAIEEKHATIFHRNNQIQSL